MQTMAVTDRRKKAELSAMAAVWCFLVMPFAAPAQFYNGSQLSFGKNRVQYQRYNWQYMRALQYDVYFYPTGRELAEYVYCKTPQIIGEIEQLLHFSSAKKLQLVVYNTQSDFRESNFAYDNDDFYNQGGVTDIYGTKVYLYFDGNRRHFDNMLRAGIMNVYARWLVQGQSVGSNMAYGTMTDIPDWFYSGLASFFGDGWNSDIEARVKDGILGQYYADFSELSAKDATYAGHSFWKYIADTYGQQSVAHALTAARVTRSMERGFYYATGLPYGQLLQNWYRYYYVMFYPDLSRSAVTGTEVVCRPRAGRHYSQFCMSPDGQSYAYVTNEAGRVKVWLKTPADTRARCIRSQFCKTEENPDLTFPLAAWHPDGGILGITVEYKGHCYYIPYVLKTKKWGRRLLVDVEKITSWQYGGDGSKMLFSGFRKGQSDIFEYSFLSRSYINLTDDCYDDYAPVYLNKSQIVFSSDRGTDSVRLPGSAAEAGPQKCYDLFLYSRGSQALLRVTRTPLADEYAALRLDGRRVAYLGDECGLKNRYVVQFDSAVSQIDTAVHYACFATGRCVTDRAYSILEHHYSPLAGMRADKVLKGGREHIYVAPFEDDTVAVPEPTRLRRQFLLCQAAGDSLAADSLTAEELSGRPRHGSETDGAAAAAVDTADTETPAAAARKKVTEMPAARFYKPQFSVNELITQADFSFLNTSYQPFEGGIYPIYLNTGFNVLFMVGINDLFEDYRFTAGFRLGLDMGSNEFMFSCEDLSRRLDRQLVLYRQSMTSQKEGGIVRQRSNSVFYRLCFPFDKMNSVRLTLTGRYESRVAGALSRVTLEKPGERHVWGGVKLEYVHDSSKELCTNLWRGAKIKVFGEYERRFEKEKLSLFVFGFDARRSFKLYKNMTFALRAAGSANVGSARLVYFMGGVDNWIGARFNGNIWVDRTKNYAYQTLATSMRGFQQNIRNGTSFVLLSGEWRVPFVQMLARRKVPSPFLNSLQLNFFVDYGTAWTGMTPYSDDNCLYTRYVQSGPVTAKITRQTDPFVAGYGVGLRASVFGYFLRVDYAWGVEDRKVDNKAGMVMFSLCKDF